MNRIAVLNLITQDGTRSRLEGWAGDIKFVVRRDQGRNDRWVLLVTPPSPAGPEAPRILKPPSKADRAAEAARDLLRRLGNPDLDDDISDLFPSDQKPQEA